MTAETGRQFSITASIGIATGSRETAEELMRDADVALYEAKARWAATATSSSRKACTPTPLDRLALEADLNDALLNDEFFLLYQPTFDLETRLLPGSRR